MKRKDKDIILNHISFSVFDESLYNELVIQSAYNDDLGCEVLNSKGLDVYRIEKAKLQNAYMQLREFLEK